MNERSPKINSGDIEKNAPETKREVVGFEIMNKPEVREKFLTRVQELIKQVETEEIDTIVFLDKSARPFSWLLRSVWKTTDSSTPMPQIRFVNIGYDERSYEDTIHSYLEAEKDVEDESILETKKDLKNIFKNQFDNQKVLIVDEYSATGRTEKFARKLFQDVFAKAEKIQSTHLFEEPNFEDDKLPIEIPWLQKLADLGLVDADEELLVKKITDADIKKFTDINETRALRNEESYQSNIEHYIDKFTKNFQRTIRKYSKRSPTKAVSEAFIDLADEIEEIDAFSFNGFESLSWVEKSQELAKLLEHFSKIPGLVSTVNHVGKASNPDRWIKMRIQTKPPARLKSYRQDCRSVFKFPEVKEFIRRSKQLRKEMKALGESVTKEA